MIIDADDGLFGGLRIKFWSAVSVNLFPHFC